MPALTYVIEFVVGVALAVGILVALIYMRMPRGERPDAETKEEK